MHLESDCINKDSMLQLSLVLSVEDAESTNIYQQPAGTVFYSEGDHNVWYLNQRKMD